MKKGDIVEGKVIGVDFPNKGIVITDEYKCMVKNALPGQTVRFSITKMRKGKPEGRLLEVLDYGERAVAKQCSHFEICGGCTYLTMTYEDQLELKKNQVKKLLDAAIGENSYIFEGIKASPSKEGYRNKMEFSFGDEYLGGPLNLGMHKRGSFYDVSPVDNCYICDTDYRKILVFTKAYFGKSGLKFFHRMQQTGYLRHLLIREGKHTGEILIALVTTASEKVDLTEFKEGLLALELKGEIVGILHTENDATADVIHNDHTEILYGRDYLNETLLGLRFNVSEFSFFQTNSDCAEVLYSTVRDYIGDLTDSGSPTQTVFDLYCGTGTISQLMAPVAKKVIGVEIVEEAVKAARENAQLNHIDNCEFIAGDVLKVIDEINEKPDFIILDPPRDGINPKALKKIIAYDVERLVYISCKPTSLARDLEMIQESGYRVIKAVAVDQFPWTANVETVCLLSKLHEEKHCVDSIK